MIRRILALAGVLGVSVLSVSLSATSTVDSPVTDNPTYWCVFQCVDGTQGGGPVSSGAECNSFANTQCRYHGGTRMTGLDPYTPPAPYWCSVWCADGTQGGGPVSSGAECNSLGNQICTGHGGTTALGLETNNIANGH
jgi:hypothetical protein